MKKYDRETKKWVDAEVLDKRQNERDKKLCRGKKPHDFVLVLPSSVTYDSTYKFNPEEYYKLMDEQYEYQEEIKKKLKALGIESKRFGFYKYEQIRYFMCSVCKKQKYE